MQTLSRQKIILNSLILKILSFIIGYSIWSIMNQSHITTFQLKIPFVFYNVPQRSTIIAPEHIFIQLQGTKKILRTLATALPAAHIDAQTLKPGDNLITLSKSTLFLPDHVQLVHTTPCPIVVTVKTS